MRLWYANVITQKVLGRFKKKPFTIKKATLSLSVVTSCYIFLPRERSHKQHLVLNIYEENILLI